MDISCNSSSAVLFVDIVDIVTLRARKPPFPYLFRLIFFHFVFCRSPKYTTFQFDYILQHATSNSWVITLTFYKRSSQQRKKGSTNAYLTKNEKIKQPRLVLKCHASLEGQQLGKKEIYNDDCFLFSRFVSKWLASSNEAVSRRPSRNVITIYTSIFSPPSLFLSSSRQFHLLTMFVRAYGMVIIVLRVLARPTESRDAALNGIVVQQRTRVIHKTRLTHRCVEN